MFYNTIMFFFFSNLLSLDTGHDSRPNCGLTFMLDPVGIFLSVSSQKLTSRLKAY